MIEPKGELKFSKVDEYTLEACDENGCKLWTLETLDHSLVQIEKDKDEENITDERKEVLARHEEYYKGLLDEASKLGIIRKSHTRTVFSKAKK